MEKSNVFAYQQIVTRNKSLNISNEEDTRSSACSSKDHARTSDVGEWKHYSGSQHCKEVTSHVVAL